MSLITLCYERTKLEGEKRSVVSALYSTGPQEALLEWSGQKDWYGTNISLSVYAQSKSTHAQICAWKMINLASFPGRLRGGGGNKIGNEEMKK